ncbi:MAG: type II secretion system F family protein [Clostridiales bacterium]|nr:type II secretion system F family protein [Clostridiales bacterium]
MHTIFIAAASSAFVFSLTLIVILHFNRGTYYAKIRVHNLFRKQLKNERKQKERKKNIKNTNRLSLKKNLLNRLYTELSLAGIKLKAEEFMIIWLISAFLPALIAFIIGADLIVSIAFMIIGVIVPYFFMKRLKAKRLALFEQQLSDALIIMGNCLKSGLSFQQSVNSIANEMPEPISKEFARVAKEVQLGITLEKALENMIERLNSKDLMLLVAAVLIQRQVGGNLSDILDGISDTIRDRLKIKASIKVLTATGRTSGMVVGLMPAFLLLILMLINPSYIRSFFESQLGIILLSIACGLEIIGFLAVNKIVNIKF